MVSDGCWEWQGKRNESGYGAFYRLGERRSHRFAWVLTNGPIPPGMFVCHHCDNPPCVRPDHLFLGTTQDNIADRMAKLRARGHIPQRDRVRVPTPRPHMVGIRNPHAKLSEAGVIDIRREYAMGGVSVASLARSFGVAKSTIFDIVHRRAWKHVPEGVVGFVVGVVAWL